jgi:hypothetical protein
VAAVVDIEVTGLPQLEAALGRLSGYQAQAIREKAILAGGRSLVRPMRAEAPMGRTGNLRKRVGARKARVGRGFGQRDPSIVLVGSVAPHRHLVIRGTKPRFTKAGASRGVMPANPFVDRAWQANADMVMARIRAVYEAEVKKVWHG